MDKDLISYHDRSHIPWEEEEDAAHIAAHVVYADHHCRNKYGLDWSDDGRMIDLPWIYWESFLADDCEDVARFGRSHLHF